MHTLIIGAGPAGLAVAGRLRHLGRSFDIVEQRDQIASSWRRHYDRLHLHTAKKFSALPHMPFPDDYPQYIPRDLLLAYYDRYAEHFQIRPHFGHEVLSAVRKDDGWHTTTSKGAFFSENLVVCTGFNRSPNMPTYPGQERFQGTIVHSSDYKNAVPYRGKNVMVVGMGNSGAEIALDLSENGAQTCLSVRGPVNVIPRDFLGRPVQQTAMLLGKLPYWLGDRLGMIAPLIAIGDLSPYGIERPNIPPAQQLRLYGRTPVIDVGTVRQIRAGKIKALPGIDHFTERAAILQNGASVELDAVVFATGYKAALQDFLQLPPGLLNERGHPVSVHPSEPKGLYFVGFDGYSSGLLWSIFRDSERVVLG
jgi:cation diffusion facilitator CzcD-associated flavoprotein CzcO